MARIGQQVSIVFEGRRADGTVFDESAEGEPLSFVIGNAEVFPKVEEAVKEMELGEERTIYLSKEDAYGTYKTELIEQVPQYVFPKSFELKEGMTLKRQRKDRPFDSIARVLKIEDGMIYLDFNHPLADEDLVYTITLVDVQGE
jgi:FKBP-type peptidyl-prolyl cis-trans isomerase 2